MAQGRPMVEFSAGGVVVDDQQRVLLIRARDLRNRAVWTLPKGAPAAGESIVDTAVREVREETGYRCGVVRELEPVAYWFQRNGGRVKKTVDWDLMWPLETAGEHDHAADEGAWLGRAAA